MRAFCQFLETNKTIITLDLLNNRITPLGCEFVGNLMTPTNGTAITILKLDHNEFGSEGVKMLATGREGKFN